MSIKKRIYWSFLILVLLFVANAIASLITINNNRKLSENVSAIINPSLESLEEFEDLLVTSKMYTTNWVFLRSNQDDKDALLRLHNIDYPGLKAKLNLLSARWNNKNMADSLHKIYSGIEQLFVFEKKIMASLQKFEDYENPVAKLESEMLVEDELLPRTSSLLNGLSAIVSYERNVRTQKNKDLEASSVHLRMLIAILAIAIILTGIFLSLYMARIIISPINKIRHIVNDLSQGIIRKVDHRISNDEIGGMISAVNNLSENLKAAASFAHETGQRNFDMPFTSLSDEDTLGKALLSMRENLKTGEANLEIQHKELERKNKELEQFAYVASHDLQEPLRTTSSFVELLQQQYQGKLDDKADKYLAYITQSVTRMKVLIADLLDYSRIGSKKELIRVDCNIVLNEVLADLDTAIQETGVEITTAHLPAICGYQTELKQLFQNLILNAIKFRQKNISPLITICAWKNTDSWQFAFSDNGIGIPKEHYERIFIIFQRLHTRNEYKGSGIGLSHCKKIVELHKGKIWLVSEPGKGTTFYFTIPQKKNNK
jgi:signal transduction histidine kinase